MTYYGGEKVVPKYNVMAVAKAALECTVRYLASDLGPKRIRVNAISAGPIKTLAARGISGLSEMLKQHADRAPLKRNVTQEEVGKSALYLLSDLASGATGPAQFVDCRFTNAVMAHLDHLAGAVSQRGYNLVPLRLYIKSGRAKVEIGLAKGRRQYEKRAAIKEREAAREMDAAIRGRAPRR